MYVTVRHVLCFIISRRFLSNICEVYSLSCYSINHVFAIVETSRYVLLYMFCSINFRFPFAATRVVEL